MAERGRLRRAAAFFGAFLLLFGAFVILLPHRHSGHEPSCAAGLLVELHHELLGVLLLCTAAAPAFLLVLLMCLAVRTLRQERDHTPVGLKVKLSD